MTTSTDSRRVAVVTGASAGIGEATAKTLAAQGFHVICVARRPEPIETRAAAIDGMTIGLLDISKPRGNVFLDRLQELLEERGFGVKRYAKPTFTKPAPADLRHQISQECNLVIEALAD